MVPQKFDNARIILIVSKDCPSNTNTHNKVSHIISCE